MRWGPRPIFNSTDVVAKPNLGNALQVDSSNDAFESPLLAGDNVILTPHIGVVSEDRRVVASDRPARYP